MKLRPDLLDSNSPPGLEILQLTENPDVPACHVYMETPVFAPDSRRFVLHESAHPHGSDADDPRHRYLLCDLGDGGRLRPLTHETGVTAPCVDPTGEWLYYFVDQIRRAPSRLILKRVRLDGSERTTLKAFEGGLPGVHGALGSVYPLSTISSDGQRLATAVGVGQDATALAVFHLDTGEVSIPLLGPREEWANLHPQYCRSLEAPANADILIQHRHGIEPHPPRGHRLQIVDIHVIREDGTGFRPLPWGRDGIEYAQGHQCWRGRSSWALSTTVTRAPTVDDPEHAECRLIESLPVADSEHRGCRCPGAVRNEVSRNLRSPQLYHFGVDTAGRRLIVDYWHADGHTLLYHATLGRPGVAAGRFAYVCDTHSAPNRKHHVHPFLSPDGRAGFFNSDESGVLQAYMLRNLEGSDA
ncbi:MAG: hypothetical protein GXP31_10960 [Kiritimatiellaeota bacterium]|nr:hypothetical protein [Kiritimatiellota bacterium]